jgi:hypothetical protein
MPLVGIRRYGIMALSNLIDRVADPFTEIDYRGPEFGLEASIQ